LKFIGIKKQKRKENRPKCHHSYPNPAKPMCVGRRASEHKHRRSHALLRLFFMGLVFLRDSLNKFMCKIGPIWYSDIPEN
jgi:hypothetical protein